jgi:solute carrier family 25 folate transporter 32
MSSHDQPSPEARRPLSPEYATPPYGLSSASDAQMRDSVAVTPLHRWALRASDSQFNAVAGAIGGFTSGIVTCPLDVIKTKLQAQGGYVALNKGRHVGQPKLYNGLVGTASVIWREEGIRGLYRGLGPIVMGYLPTWAVWFTVYNKSKVWLGPHYGKLTMSNLDLAPPLLMMFPHQKAHISSTSGPQ